MAEQDISRSLRGHALVGVCLIVGLFGGLGVWAAATEISGAVVAGGLLAVEGGSKRVQHQEGGTVREIFARDGEFVEAGALLIRLDGTTAAANLAVVDSQLSEALALKARLLAESLGADIVERPVEVKLLPASAAFEDLLTSQIRLRDTRRAAQDALIARLHEQVGQIETQIIGLEAQKAAVEEEVAVVAEEEGRVAALFADELIEITRVNVIRRDSARLRGEAARLVAEIASARAAVTEGRIQIGQVGSEFQTEVLGELQSANLQIAELLQQKIAAEDRLARLELRAPQSGIIHESTVRTIGGVIAAGETVMLIVPQASDLLVEARVSPIDVDKIYAGQAATIRLSGLDQRTTPELPASVVGVSADISHDAATGVPFYLVKVRPSESSLATIPQGVSLVPGMPADTFIRTADRTVLSYLVDPLMRQLSQTFRED